MIKTIREFKMFYHKLFVSYWCAARRYQDEAMSVFYGAMLVSLNWMLLGGFLLFSGKEIVQHFQSASIEFRVNWLLVIGGIAVFGNLVYFFGRSRWREVVGQYADLESQGRYTPHMKKRRAYLLPIVLWVLMIIAASI